ncbi:MAG: GCN5-related N-acetyltransferase [Paenibacillus sp.]|jgi:ribosomal protein S18 acetylase RimI-like enzyme|nr:GCN5-related N-acetyltransferase [Paenibacillus sp.]
MNGDVRIETVLAVEERLDELATLLIEVVEDGASVGFLPPLRHSEAIRYWKQAVSPDAVLFVALLGNQTVGTVQLHLCTKQNGSHRAEIAKLMTSPDHRRLGIGRALMRAAEERARTEEKALLVLDTREGDPSNRLYASLGYVEAGRIPMYARSANGALDATLFYYKCLPQRQM